MKQNEFHMVKRVRVNFPHLLTPPIINGEEGKCGCQLMFDPEVHSDDLAALDAEIAELTKEKFKGNKLPPERICLRDGEDKGRSEYVGYMVMSANSRTKPTVYKRGSNATIDDESQVEIYGGCYVNAKVRLWPQDNKYGKRINAELVAIQFADDGEPLDGRHVPEDVKSDGFDVGQDDNFFGEAAA